MTYSRRLVPLLFVTITPAAPQPQDSPAAGTAPPSGNNKFGHLLFLTETTLMARLPKQAPGGAPRRGADGGTPGP